MQIDGARAEITQTWDLDEDDAIQLVRDHAAALGLIALDLAVALRAKWAIRPVDYSGDQSVEARLRDRKAAYEALRRKEEVERAEFYTNMFGVGGDGPKGEPLSKRTEDEPSTGA